MATFVGQPALILPPSDPQSDYIIDFITPLILNSKHSLYSSLRLYTSRKPPDHNISPVQLFYFTSPLQIVSTDMVFVRLIAFLTGVYSFEGNKFRTQCTLLQTRSGTSEADEAAAINHELRVCNVGRRPTHEEEDSSAHVQSVTESP